MMIERMQPITIESQEDFSGRINEGDLVSLYSGEDVCDSIVYEGMSEEFNDKDPLGFIEQRDGGLLINSWRAKLVELQFDENGLRLIRDTGSLVTYDPDNPTKHWGRAYGLLKAAEKWQGELR